MIKIAPSMLSANFATLSEELQSIESAGLTYYISTLWMDILCQT